MELLHCHVHSLFFIPGPNPHLLLQHWGSPLGTGISQTGIKRCEASVQTLIHLLRLHTCSTYFLYCDSDLSSKSNVPAYIWLLCVQRLSVLHVCTCSDIIICMKTYRCSWPVPGYVDYNHIAQEVWRDPGERIWENYTRFKAPFPCLNSVEESAISVNANRACRNFLSRSLIAHCSQTHSYSWANASCLSWHVALS